MATVESFQEEQSEAKYDNRSGFCSRTVTYHSLHRMGPRHVIPADPSLNTAAFVLSHLPTYAAPGDDTAALVNSATGRRLSFPGLRRSALALSAALHCGLGLLPGDVVLLLSPNSILYPPIVIAVLAAGGVVSPANPLATSAEIAKQIRDSGAALAISAPEEAHKLTAIDIPVLLTTRSEATAAADDLVIPLSAEELMEGGDPEAAPLPGCGRGQSDAAAVLYSSGTTGASKGVVLTHGNLIAFISLLKWAGDVRGPPRDTNLAFIPMFHVYGLAYSTLGFPCTGSTTVVMPRFDLAAAMDAVARYRISIIHAVPTVLLAMLKVAPRVKWDLSSLRRIVIGAAPLAEEVAREFRRRYPWVRVRQGYGLTETVGAATVFLKSKETMGREASVGRLLPRTEGRVVDVVTERAVAPGGVGELWLRGPTVTKECLKNEEATAGIGWIRTGDLVYFDEDGYLYIVDRIKELIKCNGYQVSPEELEAVLVGHPQILDAAVIPVEDKVAGKIPMAYVVRSANSGLTSADVIGFVARQVAPYKKVRRVAFIDAIPRSAAGKILRKDLMALYRQVVVSSKL